MEEQKPMVMMKLRLLWVVTVIVLICVTAGCSGGSVPSSPNPTELPDLASFSLPDALASGRPTLAEFGWRTCIPCKEMKPILEELAADYKGKLNVVIVEVYEQEELTRQYGIMAIPTQIFFDAKGKEVTRHMGFWPKAEIITQLKKMGIE